MPRATRMRDVAWAGVELTADPRYSNAALSINP
jgi:CYTH domain-containing protein